jgi:uncharacterized membrane protein
MQPIMRIFLPGIGVLIAASLGDSANRAFDLSMGAAIGFLIADLGILGGRLSDVFKELESLRTEIRRRQDVSRLSSADSAHESAGVEYPEYTRSVQAPAAATLTADSPADALTPTPADVPPADQPHTAATAPLNRLWQDFEAQAPRPNVPHRPAASSDSVGVESVIISAVRNFFTGGNTLVRVGIIVLFFGVAFLLRYMAEHSHIPIEVRLTGVALLSIALVALGWRLRATRTGYALALQGGGVGILYLVVFAALRLYSILPAAIAFPLLALIAIISAILAILQNSMSFALLAASGGFLAPVLASTGQGSHVVLFSYYAVLNAGILAIAWFKAWRPLNVLGFVFTFAIGTAWGVLKYRPEDFATTEPFLALFFLFYLGISILFTLRQPMKLTGYIDGTLIFGTPIVVFALQTAMLHERLMSLAYSALALSALYVSIAYALKRRNAADQRLLLESFIALGIAFLTLAIPLALDARWNGATWALEGAALIWVGCRQDRLLPRAAGALLNFAAGCVAMTEFLFAASDWALPVSNYLGLLVQTAAAVFSARTLHAHRQSLRDAEHVLPGALYWWGLISWLVGGLSELNRYVPAHAIAAALVLVTFTTLSSGELYRHTQLGAARVAALLQLPAILLFAAYAALNWTHPTVHGGWWAWPIGFGGLYYLMFRHEAASRTTLATVLNAVAAWILLALLSWELAWQLGDLIAGGDSWAAAGWALIPACFLWQLPKLVTRVTYPFARNRGTYLFVAGVGVALYLAAWSLITNVESSADTSPLPYVPLLNPVDLGQVLVLLTLFRYWRFLRAVATPDTLRIDRRLPFPILAALTFIELNAVLLRTLHHWFGVQLDLEGLMSSTLVQTSLSLFWAVLALAGMLAATRKRSRLVWLVGAVLLGVVIAKLFLIDLSRSGSVERIISFVGVGLLMLVVGYFSPLPPARESQT